MAIQILIDRINILRLLKKTAFALHKLHKMHKSHKVPGQTMLENIHSKSCLVFGCGNPLFGDDGFGPETIDHFKNNYSLPGHVLCLDAGTGIRDVLFDLLLTDQKPGRIIVVDAATHDGKAPGEITEIDVDRIDPKKTSDFSLHQFPTTNMLKELRDLTAVDVRVLVVQTAHVPDEIQPGLSDPVRAAIPEMCHRLMDIIGQGTTNDKERL